MRTKNKSFGDSFKEYFNVGDIVAWKLYTHDIITGEIEPKPMTGIITKIYRSPMSSRDVWFATVFEARTAKFYNLSLMTLSLIKD